MQWWREARFGMFVHWGVYSVLAGEWNGRTDYGEWIRNNAKIPIDEYDKVLARFNPVEFNADRLARLAAIAGQKYLVITTKHHDGFALWPTMQGDFSVSRTPYKRDIMQAVATACRRHGITPCWYHSIMDWHHPDYLPRRDWEGDARPVAGAEFKRYVSFLHRQVEELLTQYGDIGVMWFDGEWESTWNRELGLALAEHCRALQPNVLVNNRVAPNRAGMLDAKRGEIGDFGTPEQNVPDQGLPGVDWESCITMNGNWGYNRADQNWKSVAQLVGLLVETASKGGNLLLNVGPTGTGAVPAPSEERLQAMGRWMRQHGEAIYGTTASPFAGTPFRATQSRQRINLFFPTWPGEREVLLPRLESLPNAARVLGQRETLPVRRVDDGVVMTLPPQATDHICSVISLHFSEQPKLRAE